jgi:hypothetical protein
MPLIYNRIAGENRGYELNSEITTRYRGNMPNKKIIGLIIVGLMCSVLGANSVIADDVALRSDHPNRYVVVKGDTLWDISARFLETPWLWPEVWSFNPQIKNPHLIYPGDVVSLVYDEQGKPMLKVERGQATVKMSPKVRANRVDKPIETVPLSSIAQFLGQPRVVSETEINNAAYIIAGTDNRLIVGKGDTIYARGLVSGGEAEYSIVRIGQAYRNQGAQSNEILGYEAIHVANAKVEEFGDPSTLKIVSSNRETLIGDRLFPLQQQNTDQTYVPHPPEAKVEGQIIAVVDGVARIGQFQTIVINKGEQDNLESGHVLAVYQLGGEVRDSRAGGDGSDMIKLPDVRAGIVLIVRAYDHISYALVMESERDMRIYDQVRNP